VEPAALERAKSLHSFALNQGAMLSTFVVTIKPDEAMELLDWYDEQYRGNACFDEDMDIARRTNDPWLVLQNFTLFGMALTKLEQLN
jgi:hypothetical protein